MCVVLIAVVALVVVVVVVVIAAYTSRGKNPGPPGNYLLLSVGAVYPWEVMKTRALGGTS